MSIEIANRLIELRKKKGLSQEELADVLGVSRQAVSKWERAEASPDTDNLIALAKFYNVSLDELLDTSTPVDDVLKDEPKEKTNKQNSKEDNIHISMDGIHVESDDGTSVHISNQGISIREPKDKDDERYNPKQDDNGFTYHFKNKDDFKNYLKKSLVENILQGTFFLLVVIAYIVLGTTCTNIYFGPLNLNAWSAFWPMFLLAPVPSSLFKAIRKRRMASFNFVSLSVGIYCFIGTFIGGWHPFWFIMLLIPVYYSLAKIIHRHRVMKTAKDFLDID